MRVKWVLFICLFAVSIAKAQQTPPPIIFFTDLIAGPASGNSDTTYGSTGGIYVTLYGNYLDNFTSVKLNGAPCLTVVSNPAAWRWYEMMVVKVGTNCTTGNFSITTPGGTWNGPTVAYPGYGRSGSPDFTVTSGVIRYVSLTGSDSNAGSYSAPWLHPYYAVQTVGALSTSGNVIYVMGGSSTASSGAYAVDDGQGWGSSLTIRHLGALPQPPRPTLLQGTRDKLRRWVVAPAGVTVL